MPKKTLGLRTENKALQVKSESPCHNRTDRLRSAGVRYRTVRRGESLRPILRPSVSSVTLELLGSNETGTITYFGLFLEIGETELWLDNLH
jgi:hypothetical protein